VYFTNNQYQEISNYGNDHNLAITDVIKLVVEKGIEALKTPDQCEGCGEPAD